MNSIIQLKETTDNHKDLSYLDCLDFAFQPIVNIHTGVCYGVEALLRNVETLGYKTTDAFFLELGGNDIDPVAIESRLYRKACEKFRRIPSYQELTLFFNMESITVERFDILLTQLSQINQMGISPNKVCLEVSERHPPRSHEQFLKMLTAVRDSHFKIALDDFGIGLSGLKMLYEVEPSFVKIDRFFIQNLNLDSKKRYFVTNIVHLAHSMSILVIAEGVETLQEFYLCKNMGCDLVQGFFVQRPTLDVDTFTGHYENIAQASARDLRQTAFGDDRLIKEGLIDIPVVHVNTHMLEVFEYFRTHQIYDFFPVINDTGESIGLIRQRDIKEWVYSLYGRELLRNRSYSHGLHNFISRCPQADLYAGIDTLLQLFTNTKTREGILITENSKYLGFLSAESLIGILHERNLKAARDQNPLTKLPGNFVVNEYINKALQQTELDFVLAYFDFNHFKPFNDKYGFRLGDRAIMLFSDVLQKTLTAGNHFIGHIGGDDFFAGFQDITLDRALSLIQHITSRFKHECESFYAPEDRAAGFIESESRSGFPKRFPLLETYAAVIHLSAGRTQQSSQALDQLLSIAKKKAKQNPPFIYSARL